MNARNVRGETPLMYAAKCTSNPEIITVLLKAGAEVNVKDESGDTPLHAVANQVWYGYGPLSSDKWQLNKRRTEVITILLEAGADTIATNMQGQTALDCAKENKDIYKTDAYSKLNDAFHNQ